MTIPILSVNSIRKVYPSTVAVEGVSFSIGPGEIVGLLGPNGAGKTTTIAMILGVLEPTAGSISILGHDLQKNRQARLYMNFAAVYAQLPGNITVWQNLYTFALLYGVELIKENIARLAREYDFEQFLDTKMGLLSSGEQARVNLAKAMINKPKLLLLDEPTASLDPSSSHLLRDSIRTYIHTTQSAALWTSHDMHEVEAVCDRVLFVSHGNVLLEGNPRTLARQHGKENLEELFIAVAREPLSFT